MPFFGLEISFRLRAPSRLLIVLCANVTNKSEKNAELVFIMKGPPVLQIMETVAADTAGAVEWDGK